MKLLIVEDEKPAAEHIQALIKRYDPKIEVLATMDSVKKTVAWLSENPHPDLILMDIQLADGLSFEIFEHAKVNCPIIFTTAFNEYAIKAFKVNSIDYLLKPIDFSDLKAAMEKYYSTFASFKSENYLALFDQVMSSLNKDHKQRFVIKVGEHIKSVQVGDIYFFFSLEKATYLRTNDNHNYVIDYSLDQVESLVDPNQFFRINRKYLIRMEAVDDIITYSNSRLKIELKQHSDQDAIVAREKVNAFKKWLDR